MILLLFAIAFLITVGIGLALYWGTIRRHTIKPPTTIPDDYYVGGTVVLQNGAYRRIISFNGSTDTDTVTLESPFSETDTRKSP